MFARSLLPALLLLAAVSYIHAKVVDKGDQSLPLCPPATFQLLNGQCTGQLDFSQFFVCPSPSRIGRARVEVDEPGVQIYVNDQLAGASVTRAPPCQGAAVGTLRVGCTQVLPQLQEIGSLHVLLPKL